MPIYEFKCQDCGQKFDLFRSFSQADDPVQCVHCQSPHVERQLSRLTVLGVSGSSRKTGCSGCSGSSCSSCH